MFLPTLSWLRCTALLRSFYGRVDNMDPEAHLKRNFLTYSLGECVGRVPALSRNGPHSKPVGADTVKQLL